MPVENNKVGLRAFFFSPVCLWVVHLGAIAISSGVSLVSPSLAANRAITNTKPQLHQIPQAIAQYPDTIARVPEPVSAIARSVTVRILGEQGTGSGVIVGHQGQTYTVLTNAHVVAQVGGDRYTILTADGITHTGVWLHSAQLGNYDLALMQFSSHRLYQVAVMGNSNILSVGEIVYASGFPSWRVINANTLADTRNWGLQAFELTQGYIGMLPRQSLQQGYQLGYTNQIEPGMSGGPVLDRYGHLIAINGGLKYPIQGITAFIFADSTMPSQALFEQMQALSWAIPIAKFQQLFGQPTHLIQGSY
ncbi:trypsin-like serine protease [Scytonema sp. UIC 10036]|uniref:S1 family peptidase n=1 Tax=Scytonema sp. UIC 10036 TaxID=2304196 RepID=UPI0012DAA6AE|nr:serine protease [Scytonema sp. UIC 10036]MUG91534.1 trypsin-like serine protease [Scytonema sp. UIC 10036]